MPTGRVLVNDLPEFIIIRCLEVVATDVLLELCVRPRMGMFGGIMSRPEAYSRDVEAG